MLAQAVLHSAVLISVQFSENNILIVLRVQLGIGFGSVFCGQPYVAPVSKQHTRKQSVAIPPCVAGFTGTVKTIG